MHLWKICTPSEPSLFPGGNTFGISVLEQNPNLLSVANIMFMSMYHVCMNMLQASNMPIKGCGRFLLVYLYILHALIYMYTETIYMYTETYSFSLLYLDTIRWYLILSFDVIALYPTLSAPSNNCFYIVYNITHLWVHALCYNSLQWYLVVFGLNKIIRLFSWVLTSKFASVFVN